MQLVQPIQPKDPAALTLLYESESVNDEGRDVDERAKFVGPVVDGRRVGPSLDDAIDGEASIAERVDGGP